MPGLALYAYLDSYQIIQNFYIIYIFFFFFFSSKLSLHT